MPAMQDLCLTVGSGEDQGSFVDANIEREVKRRSDYCFGGFCVIWYVFLFPRTETLPGEGELIANVNFGTICNVSISLTFTMKHRWDMIARFACRRICLCNNLKLNCCVADPFIRRG